MSKVTFFWFRRDLRLEDNVGLFHALRDKARVQPIFIFDLDILSPLDRADRRVSFLVDAINRLKRELQALGSDILIRVGKPEDVWKDLLQEFSVDAVYINSDYEPYARKRDQSITELLRSQGVELKSFKDQCLFEKDEVLTGEGRPYSVYTAYKNCVLKKLGEIRSFETKVHFKNFERVKTREPDFNISDLGFLPTEPLYPEPELSTSMLKNYHKTRDFPAQAGGTSHLGVHLRFGTVSVRKLAKQAQLHSPVFLSELIWRDFFMQILWHFPRVESQSYRPQFDKIKWRESPKDFKKWCEGRTGYPLVDAGMRELLATGFMHNRVRMVTASFLTKHLLIHWLKGERYFAKLLLDYDLAANNGNWQWVAGSGCDAAPYFRVFNPTTQIKRFDPNFQYIKKWVPEWGTDEYPKPMVEHVQARDRALHAFSAALKGSKK